MRFSDLFSLTIREGRIQKKIILAMILVQVCLITVCVLLWTTSLSIRSTLSAYLNAQYPEGETVVLIGADYTQRTELLDAGFSEVNADCMGDFRSTIRCTDKDAVIDKESYLVSYLWTFGNTDLTAVSGQLWTVDTEETPAIWLSEHAAAELGCGVGDAFVFESYTKTSEEFPVLGIYPESDAYGDVIVNFVPYINMISEIGIPQSYSMTGTAEQVSDLPEIRSACEKIGVTFSSKAEPWFSSMNMIQVLLYGVSALLTLLYWMTLLHFCGMLLHRRTSFTVLCCFLGAEKGIIGRLHSLLLCGILDVSALPSAGIVTLGTFYINKAVTQLTGASCFTVSQALSVFALFLLGGFAAIGVSAFIHQKRIKLDASALEEGGAAQ